MSAWTTSPIEDLCEAVVDCVNKTAPTVDGPTPYKMIRTTNVRFGRVDTSNVRYVEPDVFERWTRRITPRRGDVILTREAPLGEVGLVRSDDQIFLGQRTVAYRANKSKSDERFLAYALQGPQVQADLRSLGSGSTVEHLRVPDCLGIPIAHPDLRTQQRIGDVLGSIDDLIENNRRRIEVLEEMAQAVYREWFVHFRFPGHEDATFVDSPLGPIPKGWEVLPSSELLSINPRIRVSQDAECDFITMSDLNQSGMVCHPSAHKAGGSGSKFQNGDTLFARITPCLENGKTGFVASLAQGAVGRGSTEFVVFRGNEVGPCFTYLLARSEDFRQHAMKSMSGASGRQRVRNECFDAYFAPAPPRVLAEEFESGVSPLFDLVYAADAEASKLESLRDLLLPKLVTGEIDVSELDLDSLVEAAG